ncbi:hypothetical protein [Metaclostridioides mangenotii]|uniref:Uncharacterized protein n=1 Tax=Metaclostridioides mangenotii TaxID=1540 RepID=A0ABS4E7Y8_9FIRM|nr:hypothetical protein [Clostridioides mangenotii]MBP1854051.1 hypothetical protein [Clostridioides mangenotii]
MNTEVISALIGAIIGGIFTIIGANFSFKKELRSKSNIDRLINTYEPLYNEVSKNHNSLIDFSMPNISFSSIDTSINSINYKDLFEILNDSRSFSIPKNIYIKLKNFHTSIEEYNLNLDNALNSINKVIYNPYNLHNYDTLSLSGRVVLSNLLLSSHYNRFEFDDQESFDSYKLILPEILKLSEIDLIENSYKNLLDNEKELINEVEEEIKTINYNYKYRK